MDTRTTARRGIDSVTRELVRRGWRVSKRQEGRRPLLLAEARGERRRIAVSARTAGTWQTSISYGRKPASPTDKDRVWVFVDLSDPDPRFYVVPYQWMSEDIHDSHEAYLRRHGGRRAGNPDSTHHAVPLRRIAHWLERWDLLAG